MGHIHHIRFSLSLSLGLLWPMISVARQPLEKKGYNILIVMVDDLRPVLGCYNNKLARSPNIDKLAKNGVLFRNAYCNVPVCGASRASLFTGMRPTRNRFVDHLSKASFEAPGAICLPQLLKNNGYATVSLGKVFHHQDDCNESWGLNWRPETNGTWHDYHVKENIPAANSNRPFYECANVPDTAYFDGKLAQRAIAELEKFKGGTKPFFLAVGFVKPHLPFTAPKKYWDLHLKSKYVAPLQQNWPMNAPRCAFHDNGELRQYSGIPAQGFVPDSTALYMLHGYYACVSYTDAQIGLLLDALQDNGFAGNTIVVLLGDHGWNLGEHGLWCKHSVFRTSVNAPLIVSVPGMGRGFSTAEVVEFIDIYPTICSLVGLDAPKSLEGECFMPLLATKGAARKKDYAITKWADGVCIATQQYAYTEWRNGSDKLYATMLYDHIADIDETNNVAGNVALKDIQATLATKLMQFRGESYLKPGKPYKLP